jgi:hypothetical protein
MRLAKPCSKAPFLNHTPGVLNEQQQNIRGFRGKWDSLATSEEDASRTVQTEPAEFIETLIHSTSWKLMVS